MSIRWRTATSRRTSARGPPAQWWTSSTGSARSKSCGRPKRRTPISIESNACPASIPAFSGSSEPFGSTTTYSLFSPATKPLLRLQKAPHPIQCARFAEDDQALQQLWAGGFAREDRPQQHEVVLHGPLLVDAELLQRGLQRLLSKIGRLQHRKLLGRKRQRLRSEEHTS